MSQYFLRSLGALGITMVMSSEVLRSCPWNGALNSAKANWENCPGVHMLMSSKPSSFSRAPWEARNSSHYIKATLLCKSVWNQILLHSATYFSVNMHRLPVCSMVSPIVFNGASSQGSVCTRLQHHPAHANGQKKCRCVQWSLIPGKVWRRLQTFCIYCWSMICFKVEMNGRRRKRPN